VRPLPGAAAQKELPCPDRSFTLKKVKPPLLSVEEPQP
jgi:hypothetical protein